VFILGRDPSILKWRRAPYDLNDLYPKVIKFYLVLDAVVYYSFTLIVIYGIGSITGTGTVILFL
jgi:hypothetical protein